MLLPEVRPGDFVSGHRDARRQRPAPHLATVAAKYPSVLRTRPLPLRTSLVVQRQVTEVEVRWNDPGVTARGFVASLGLESSHKVHKRLAVDRRGQRPCISADRDYLEVQKAGHVGNRVMLSSRARSAADQGVCDEAVSRSAGWLDRLRPVMSRRPPK